MSREVFRAEGRNNRGKQASPRPFGSDLKACKGVLARRK